MWSPTVAAGAAPRRQATPAVAGFLQDVLPIVADHQLAPVTLTVAFGAAVLVEVPRVARRRVRHGRIIAHAYDTARLQPRVTAMSADQSPTESRGQPRSQYNSANSVPRITVLAKHL
jgi:hypothetical protein